MGDNMCSFWFCYRYILVAVILKILWVVFSLISSFFHSFSVLALL